MSSISGLSSPSFRPVVPPPDGDDRGAEAASRRGHAANPDLGIAPPLSRTGRERASDRDGRFAPDADRPIDPFALAVADGERIRALILAAAAAARAPAPDRTADAAPGRVPGRDDEEPWDLGGTPSGALDASAGAGADAPDVSTADPSRGDFATPGGYDPDAAYGDRSDEYLDFIADHEEVARGAGDDFAVERVGESWEDVPRGIREGDPDSLWGDFVDDRGNHPQNTRLPGGMHITVDEPDGPVNLHQDAYDPVRGPFSTFGHYVREVLPQQLGRRGDAEPRDDRPDWSPVPLVHTTRVDPETGAITRTTRDPRDDSGTISVSTPDVPGAANSPVTNVTTTYDAEGGAVTTTTVTSPTGMTYEAAEPPADGATSGRDAGASRMDGDGSQSTGPGSESDGAAAPAPSEAASGSGMGPDGARDTGTSRTETRREERRSSMDSDGSQSDGPGSESSGSSSSSSTSEAASGSGMGPDGAGG